jgi:predicted small lipoprotein YifL
MQLRSSLASRLTLLLALLLGIATVTGLAGCGQKGPLKLPNPQAPAPAGAASAPTK